MTAYFKNKYKCPKCGDEWESVDDGCPDDDCGSCGMRHISPYESLEAKFDQDPDIEAGADVASQKCGEPGCHVCDDGRADKITSKTLMPGDIMRFVRIAHLAMSDENFIEIVAREFKFAPEEAAMIRDRLDAFMERRESSDHVQIPLDLTPDQWSELWNAIDSKFCSVRSGLVGRGLSKDDHKRWVKDLEVLKDLVAEELDANDVKY